MANKKVENGKANSFIIYKDYETYIETLTREQRGDIFSALFVYFRTGEIPDGLDNESKLLMKVFAVQMDRDLKKYDKMVEARRKAGIKSAEAKKMKLSLDDLNEYDEEDSPGDATSTDLADADSVTDDSTNSTYVTFVEHNSTSSTNSTNNSNSNNNINNNINNNYNNNNNDNNNDNDNDNDNTIIIDTNARLKQIYSRLYDEK